LLTSTWSKT